MRLEFADLQFQEMQAVNKMKTNPKYFSSYSMKFSKKKRNISMLFDQHNQVCVQAEEIANILQQQFTSVFSDPSKTNIPSATKFQTPEIPHLFTDDMLHFSPNDISMAINEIDSYAASGPDEIPAILLKNCKHTMAIPIHLMWQESLSSGAVPTFYKTSHVSPVYKKGSRALAENYRPISLTSHITKIYERVLRKQIVDYLELNELLCDKQHGFRSGKSCLTQLLHHIEDVIEALTNGADADAIYLHYAKAFDKVDHNLLIKKMHILGIHPKIILWIENFLSNRTQKVVVDGYVSIIALIISGVPQGTVLGPKCFLIFINDIYLCIKHSTTRCFADDTRLLKAIICNEADVTTLQSDLDSVIKWSVTNNMTLHEDKFEFICHRSTKSNMLCELPTVCQFFQYTTSNGSTLHPVKTVRDLGITVSEDLSWAPHINIKCDKAQQMLAWVFSVFHTRRTEVMLTLFKSLVRSILEYCSPLWNPLKVAEIQELECV